ncbi:MAG: hypothetical protein ACO3C1_09410 [Ilumatobacteraceae bacterium]
MDMQRRVGALLVALTGVVVACGSEEAIGVSALPEGVFLAVVSPDADGSAKASVESPLDVTLQVDPRVIGTNCTIAVTIVVSDSTGEFSNRRLATIESPIATELVKVSVAFSVADASAKPSDGEEPIDVPVDLPANGDYQGFVQAELVAPEADDPASLLSKYEMCRTRLGLLPGVSDGLGASRSFGITIVDGVVVTEPPNSEVSTTAGDSTSSSESSTTQYRWTGGGGSRTTTTTTPGSVTTTTRPTTVTTTTQPAITTTTVEVTVPPPPPPTTVDPGTTLAP